jgi:uncharacterized protein (TIGR02453 family)
MGTFSGFPAAAVSFYGDLERDNTRQFWVAHRETYEVAVREPMSLLLEELEPEFGPGKVFRPYRDLRFSRDKAPYKTHQGAFVELVAGTGFYVHLDADGLMVGGGFHAHTPPQIERFRRAVDDEPSGVRLVRLVDELTATGFEIGGDRLKTRPRGYPPDHPRIDLLRHRSLTVHHGYGCPPWLSTPDVAERVRAGWRTVRPLNDWLVEHVGPPDG